MGIYFADTGISQFTSFGSSSKHAEVGPEAVGIVVSRFVGTRAGYYGPGLAQLSTPIRLDIEDSRPDP